MATTVNTTRIILLEIFTLGFLLSPAVSTRDPIIKPESVSSMADNGQGWMMSVMTKVLWSYLIYTYSKSLFQNNLIENAKKKDFHSKIEELCHKIRMKSLYLTSQIPWRA